MCGSKGFLNTVSPVSINASGKGVKNDPSQEGG